MTLSGEQFQQLHTALLSAFPDKGPLKLLVRTGLGQNLGIFAGGNSLSEIVYGLIEWAEAHGQLEELVRKAYDANPGNPDLLHFAEPFLKRTATTSPRVLLPNESPPFRFELRGMDWYEEADADYLYGRETDVKKLRDLLMEYPVVRLSSPSGVGKSSLLRAGLLPALRRNGWRAAVVRPYTDPARRLPDELRGALLTADSPPFTSPLDVAQLRAEIVPLLQAENCKCLVLLIDQVEDILSPSEADALADFRKLLFEIQHTQALTPMLKAVVAHRTDADARLGPIWQEVSGQPSGLPYHSLMGLSRDDASDVINKAADRRRWTLGADAQRLADQLMLESQGMEASGEIYPPYLQILLTEANTIPEGRITEEFIASGGGVGGILGKYLENTLRTLEKSGGEWRHCRKILEALSRSSGEKVSRTEDEIADYARLSRESLHPLLAELVRLRLIRPLGGGQYEILHDRLAKAVLEGMQDIDHEFKAIAELLAIKTINYPRTGELLTRNELHQLYRYRHRLNFHVDEKRFVKDKRFVFCSMLTEEDSKARELGWFWFTHNSSDDLAQLLLELARHQYSSVQQAAIKAIGQFQQPEALSLLRELVGSENLSVRQVAKEAIGLQQQLEDLLQLRRLMKSKYSSIRQAAIKAIGQLQQPEALSLLRESARSKLLSVQRAAIEAIGLQQQLIGLQQQLEDLALLGKLARDKNNNLSVRQAAIEAIWQFQQPEALSLLRELVGSKYLSVRQAAKEAIGPQQLEDLPLLRELARDKYLSVRQAAVGLLIRSSTHDELEQWLSENATNLSFDVLSVLDRHLYCPTWWKEAQRRIR